MSKTNGGRAPSGLNPNQARFVEEYLVDLNATQAAIRAGYSAKTAEVQGPRLLGNARIRAAIEVGVHARSERTGITQDRVLRELELLSFSDLQHYRVTWKGDVVLVPGAPSGAMRALASIKRRISTRGTGKKKETVVDVEIKLWDKPGPLRLAGQHVGLFAELGDKKRPIHEVTKVTFGGRYRPEATT